MQEIIWNPWHGCIKFSEGCKNCYVYRRDESFGKDSSLIEKTLSFDLPIRLKKNGQYKIPPGSTVFTCMTSDFFIENADDWREDIWDIIKKRMDLNFIIITKRIHRFLECIPDDWGNGYINVSVYCTVENQRQCDIRLPIFTTLPIAEKGIICEPLLSDINMSEYLNSDCRKIIVGGESGTNARECNYDWVLNIRRQAIEKNISFSFKQTGANFIKDKKVYNIPRSLQHIQAKKAGIDKFF